MSLHKEISFEDEVCEYLGSNGWLYEPKAAERYDRARALFTPDLIAWVQATQPQALETLTKNHGTDTQNLLLERIRKQLDTQGILDVLRYGVETYGLRQPISLAQFKPAFGMNTDLTAKYDANRLRVVRQVHYSKSNENSIDLVLFLNGIPVATVELKTDFTQSVKDAIDQYRFDRDPKPKGQSSEPLLTFSSGALVHFAVSNTEAYMTTKLVGSKTRFLPFNKGNNGGAGNSPSKGHPTSYLWEEVWERHSWLEIIGRYLVAEKNDKKQIEKIIFPRYHQLDVTRKLSQTVLSEGVGHKYLIQHSAGSGKTNSIAWTAHFLADLHKDNNKVFSTVIVVSDRNVIDGQLRDALDNFERTKGVVAAITNDSGSKSQQLAEALAQNKKIIVCTIQTFPYALEAVREQASAHGKTFAVIADEAHSSQAGTTAAKLRKVLSAQEQADMDDGGELSYEDILAAEMAERADEKGITFVAFTATPKAKTLELFGRRPNPQAPNGPDNLPAPFHVYSMRQAIEEGFILDVLRNYTPYDLAFKLMSKGKEMDDKEIEKSAALKSIMSWVRLHPYSIAKKVEIVVEHFRQNVAPLLDGKGKAMVVLASRKEAVRWQLAITKYIQKNNYKIGTLVAFSGEVNDAESGPDPFTENSKQLNPQLNGKEIKEAFKGEDYQILLVANKFQTGFDQPLLCGMYIDRRLAGIQAVQTLSRLNRSYEGKDTTYILDFANSAEEILDAFKTYYETATLEATTDPNIVFDLRAKLDASGFYDDKEVDEVAKVEVDSKSKQSDLVAAIEPVASRLLSAFKTAKSDLKIAQSRQDPKAEKSAKDRIETLILFKADMGTYQRLYSFLSQIFDFGNTDLEKRAIFFRRLIPLLEFGRERDGVDLTQIELTHHKLKSSGKRDLTLGDGDAPTLSPLTDSGSGFIQEKEKARLADIIERVNGLFEGQISDEDQLVYVNNVLKGKLLQSEELVTQAKNNSKAQFTNSPTLKDEFMNAIIDSHEAHVSMSSQAINSEKIRAGLIDILLGPGGLYEALKERGESLHNNRS